MRMNFPFILGLLVILTSPDLLFAQEFQSYKEEVSRAKAVLKCSTEKDVQATKNFGALYVCTIGKAKTAKWFISEKPGTGRVQNIGLMWIDWQVDNGFGIRADWKEVEKALNFLISRYVPTRRIDLNKAFWDSSNEDFSTPDFRIYYTIKPDHQKDERIVVIEENRK